jgi:hypothetical protein
MPWRVLTYEQRIWATLLRQEPQRTTLPPIITIVVHHGESGWTSPRRFHGIIDGLDELPELRPFVPDFELAVDDLIAIDDAVLQQRPLAPFAKVALWLLRDGRSLARFLAHLAAWATELERLMRGESGREDYGTVLRYIWKVVGEGPYELVRTQIVEVAPTFGEAMPSVEEQLIQKGRREGARDILTRQLRARFGALDAAAESRIGKASADELDRWIERVVLAEGIDDVFQI